MITDNHENRMTILLQKEESFLANMLAYISGYMADDPLFQEAWEGALMDTIV